MPYCSRCGSFLEVADVACQSCGAPNVAQTAWNVDGDGPRGLANFGQRLGGLLIDVVILFAALIPLSAADAVGGLVWLAGVPLYFIYFEGSASGQTVGKRAVGIRVMRIDGAPLGSGAATGRTFARLLSQALFGLGYWWMLWDPRRQTFHDKLAGTNVVTTDAHPVTAWPG